jgi:hypothetical protein
LTDPFAGDGPVKVQGERTDEYCDPGIDGDRPGGRRRGANSSKDIKAKESDRELVARLVDQARAKGVELVGENGLLGRLTKLVLESALEGEITDHLGCDKHQRSGGETTNTATAPDPQRSSLTSGRSRSACRAIGTAASSRRSCASGNGACPVSMRWSSRWPPRA